MFPNVKKFVDKLRCAFDEFVGASRPPMNVRGQGQRLAIERAGIRNVLLVTGEETSAFDSGSEMKQPRTRP